MKEMKKLFPVIIGTICAAYANAYDFKDGKIYYNIKDNNNKTVAVTRGDTKYEGDISIPEEATYEGSRYSVKSIEMEAFSGCSQLQKVEIPNSVTEIGSEVFYGCTSLESAVIGNGVKEVPWLAFAGCSNLKKVVLGSSVETIGDHAFKECSSLTDINIGDHVVTICPCAFLNCTALSSVTIGRSMREIGGSAFKNCTSLAKLVIHEGVETMGIEAFSGCSQLQKVEIPNSVTKMDIEVFMYCSGLESVVIGNGVKEIPSHTFTGCKALKDVTIGSSVEAITVFSFKECVNIKDVTSLIQNPCTFESSAFPNNVYDDATLYVPKGTVGKYQSTDSWKKFYKIKEIGGTSDDLIVFADPEVKRICVENWDANGDGELSKSEAAAVTDLGRSFSRNEKITSFNEFKYFIGLREIGEVGSLSAFELCRGLTTITIPNSVISINSGSFIYCESLSSISVEAENCVYDSRNNCNAIIETASNTLIVGCKNTIIPNDVMAIDDYAYCGSKDLASISIPNNVTRIGERAFWSCDGLLSITLVNSVKIIGFQAFQGCKNLTSIIIPSSVTAIGEGAFSYCSGLSSIIVEEGNSIYDSRNGCNAIIETASNTLIAGCKNTVIPSDIASVGDYSFEGCNDMTSIAIPNSVISIGLFAFSDCSGLSSIVIPQSVKSIDQYAFQYCFHLTTIISHIQDPFVLDLMSFGYFTSSDYHLWCPDATLYVPVGTKAKYEITEGWKEFKNIVEGEPDPSAIQSLSFMTTTDIYSISGHKVRLNATSLEGLPQGIYIVNGKKVIK